MLTVLCRFHHFKLHAFLLHSLPKHTTQMGFLSPTQELQDVVGNHVGSFDFFLETGLPKSVEDLRPVEFNAAGKSLSIALDEPTPQMALAAATVLRTLRTALSPHQFFSWSIDTSHAARQKNKKKQKNIPATAKAGTYT
jgi:hypothetical protein